MIHSAYCVDNIIDKHTHRMQIIQIRTFINNSNFFYVSFDTIAIEPGIASSNASSPTKLIGGVLKSSQLYGN